MSEETKRAQLKAIELTVEYSDGTSKKISVDPNEFEALFWSDSAVLEILAPYYNKPRVLDASEQIEVQKDIGFSVSEITPSVVKTMWESKNGSHEKAELPALLFKKIKCIPTRTKCIYCHDV